MLKRNYYQTYLSFVRLTTLVFFFTFLIFLFSFPAFAASNDKDDNRPWTIHFNPGVRFGTDNRMLYILDFLLPLYQDNKNILFANPRYTPNDQDGWEVNLGLGYRRLFLHDRLILGVNGFYDKRETSWGTQYEQWGIGTEVMADVPVGNIDLGLTGRVNYYHPLSEAKIYLGPNGGYVYRGGGIYTFDDAWVEDPLGGVDGEIGVRIPYVSDYVETWIYGGGYHFEGKYIDDVNGISARVEVIPTSFLRLNYEYRSDRIEHNQHYGEVMVEVPFSIENLISGKNPFEGFAKRIGGTRELKERLVEPVRRDVDVKMVRLTGGDAAHVLGKLYIVYAEPDDDYNLIVNLDKRIVGAVIFVSENAEQCPEGQRNGTKAKPYASIAEAIEKEKDVIESGHANTICVINDNPYEPPDAIIGEDQTYEPMPADTWAGGGVIDYVGMLILGTGIEYPNIPQLRQLPTGYPTIGETLTIAAPDVSVLGLKFRIFNEKAAITIKQSEKFYRNRPIYSNINIMSNIINVNTGSGDAYGIETDFDYSRPYSEVNVLLGTEVSPVRIIGNTFDVSTNNGDAFGIELENRDLEIYTEIFGNKLHVTATDSAYGIKLLNSYTTVIDHETDNEPDIIAGIRQNEIEVYSSDSYGICTKTSTGDIGLTIVDNPWIKVYGADRAYGIYIHSIKGTSTSFVEGNALEITSGEDNVIDNSAYGIYINSDDYSQSRLIRKIASKFVKLVYSLGWEFKLAYRVGEKIYEKLPENQSQPLYADISANYINLNSQGNSYGVYLSSGSSVFADINGNAKTNENGTIIGGIDIQGEGDVYGVFINAGHIGVYKSLTDEDLYKLLAITGNSINVLSRDGSSYGINLMAEREFDVLEPKSLDILKSTYLFANIADNSIKSRGNVVCGNAGSYGISLMADITLQAINDLHSHVGSKDNPVLLFGNTVDVENLKGNAYGISLNSRDGDLFANILYNSYHDENFVCLKDESGNYITSEYGINVKGGEKAYGIYLSSEDNMGVNPTVGVNYGDSMPVNVSGNTVSVEGSESYGIFGRSREGDLHASVTKNGFLDANLSLVFGAPGITVSGNAAYGISLDAYGSLGRYDGIATVSNNSLKVTNNSGSPDADTYGIRLSAGNYLLANIDSNDLLGGVRGGSNVSGLFLHGGVMGSAELPISITGNKLTATSGIPTGIVNGIYATGGSLYAQIKNNDLSDITDDKTGGIRGGGDTYGIRLETGTLDTLIESNTMHAESANGTAYGMYLKADDELYTTIFNNRDDDGLSGISVRGGKDAYGIYIDSGDIGSDITFSAPERITNISFNSLYVDGQNNAYGIYAQSQYNMFLSIHDNKKQNGEPGIIVNGGANAYGVYLFSYEDMGRGSTVYKPAALPVTIFGNIIEAESSAVTYGIYARTVNNMFLNITNNKGPDNTAGLIVSGNISSTGIYLDSMNDIGSSRSPISISGNTMSINSVFENAGDIKTTAYGIFLNTEDTIYADITGGNVINAVSNNSVNGIRIASASEDLNLHINNNSISLSSIFGNVDWLYREICRDRYSEVIYDYQLPGINGIICSGRNVLGAISNNSITVDGFDASISGISLRALDSADGTKRGNIGSLTQSFVISGNNISVICRIRSSSLEIFEYGIYGFAYDSIIASIQNNPLISVLSESSIPSNSPRTYGVCLEAGIIGDYNQSKATYLINNTGVVGGLAPLLVEFWGFNQTGESLANIGSGSLGMGSNNFTHPNGAWNYYGNYGPGGAMGTHFPVSIRGYSMDRRHVNIVP
jgi:hypothetical protein